MMCKTGTFGGGELQEGERLKERVIVIEVLYMLI
jgi:hypothetical protein